MVDAHSLCQTCGVVYAIPHFQEAADIVIDVGNAFVHAVTLMQADDALVID